uniref:Partner of Y14 and mago n=1 Tax=Trichuris muris TaxID=70415 RepID=A0A5S6QEC6_TRIMR
MSRVKGADGNWYIPATQRPNGTWRQAQRVREGYVPPEERLRYKAKCHDIKVIGHYPVGLDPTLVEEQEKKFRVSQVPARPETTCTLEQLVHLQLNLNEKVDNKRTRKKLREAKKLQKTVAENPDIVLNKEQMEKIQNISYFTMKIEELMAQRRIIPWK